MTDAELRRYNHHPGHCQRTELEACPVTELERLRAVADAARLVLRDHDCARCALVRSGEIDPTDHPGWNPECVLRLRLEEAAK